MPLTKTKAKVLLVQNAQTQGNSTKRYLEGAGYAVLWAGSGLSALAAVKQQAVDVILIDVALPDVEGSDLCRRFRSRDETRNVPIILFTARGQEPAAPLRREAGPDDYLPRPYTEGELEEKIGSALMRRAQAVPRQAAASGREEEAGDNGIVPVRGIEPQPDSGPIVAKGSPAVPRPEEPPDPAAFPGSPGSDDEVIDAETGLFGKKQFDAMFSKEFKKSVRFKQQMSCMIIDLDGRTIGREGNGDTLRAVVGLVQRTIREVDTAAWWSGEALIVLLPNTTRNDAVQAAARILESVANHPFSWPDASRVTLSIGVAGLPDGKLDTDQKLIEAAAAACRRARDLMVPGAGKQGP